MSTKYVCLIIPPTNVLSKFLHNIKRELQDILEKNVKVENWIWTLLTFVSLPSVSGDEFFSGLDGFRREDAIDDAQPRMLGRGEAHVGPAWTQKSDHSWEI